MDVGPGSLPLDVRPSGEERLDSWKEIAEYLKRSVRTVRRWEADENLPVHRHIHQAAGTVYAFRAELDAWLASRTPPPSVASPEEALTKNSLDPAAAPAVSPSNARRPIVVIAVLGLTALLASLGALRFPSVPRASSPAFGSVAVLPLSNLTGDPAQAYLADGMTDALITELAQLLSGVRVISRTSVVQYKDAASKRLAEIARELNVDGIVEGAVVRSGSQVRVTAHLVDARTDRQLWARSYERDLNDLVRLQREVAHAIGEAVAGKLPPLDPGRESRRVDPDAYRLFVQGLIAASRQTYEGWRNASTYFQQAIEKDPTFAAVYARMGLNYLQYSFSGTFEPNQFMPEAESAARKAVELDDALAEAHAVLGTVLYRYRWDWSDSEKEFRRALTLNPNYAEGHRMFAAMLSATGRSQEAVAEAQRARDLDPLMLNGMLSLGQAYRAAGEHDLALAQFRAGLERDPNRSRVHFQIGITCLEKGLLTEGIRELETAVALSQRNLRYLAALAYAYARSGRATDARTILAELETLAKNQYVAPTAIARIYLGLDDRRTAHAWIERAYQEHDAGLVLTAEDIGLAELRSDPDFHDVFSRMGLAR